MSDTEQAQATSSEQTPADETLPTEEEVKEALKVVQDPELGISIVDLGLVYGVQLDPDSHTAIIDMTLTTPACPLGPIIKTQAWATITTETAEAVAAVSHGWLISLILLSLRNSPHWQVVWRDVRNAGISIVVRRDSP